MLMALSENGSRLRAIHLLYVGEEPILSSHETVAGGAQPIGPRKCLTQRVVSFPCQYQNVGLDSGLEHRLQYDVLRTLDIHLQEIDVIMLVGLHRCCNRNATCIEGSFASEIAEHGMRDVAGIAGRIEAQSRVLTPEPDGYEPEPGGVVRAGPHKIDGSRCRIEGPYVRAKYVGQVLLEADVLPDASRITNGAALDRSHRQHHVSDRHACH